MPQSRHLTRDALLGLLLCTSVSALCLVPAMGGAQTIAQSSSVAADDAIARLKYSTITDQFLIELHRNLVAALQKQSGSEDGSGNFVAPPLVSYLASNVSLSDFTGQQAALLEYNETNAADRGLYHRVCPDPAMQGQYYVLTYMIPPTGYKYGLDAAQMQAAAPQYFSKRQQQFLPAVSGAGLVTVTGTTTKTGTYQGWGQAPQALPDCIVNGSDWPAFADGTYLAQFSTIFIAGSGVRIWKSYDHKWASCPAGSDPNATIGVAFMTQETDTAKKLDGTVVGSTTGPWTYESGCADPRTQVRNILRRCDYPFMSTTAVGFQTYSQIFKQVANPNVAPDPKNAAAQWSWQPDTSKAPVLVSSSCPGTAPVTPFSATNTSAAFQTQNLSCQAVYPNPQPYPWIGYSGTYTQRRTVSTTTETLPAGSNPSSISATNYSPWQTMTDTCSRAYQTSTQETRTLTCPSGYTGSVTEARTDTTTTTQYASGSPATQSSTNYGGWTTTSNTCQQVYCVSAQDYGGRNNDRYLVTMSNGASYFTINPPSSCFSHVFSGGGDSGNGGNPNSGSPAAGNDPGYGLGGYEGGLGGYSGGSGGYDGGSGGGGQSNGAGGYGDNPNGW